MSRLRILILDDNSQVLEVGRRMIDRLGFEAEVVSEGAKAVARYSELRGTSQAFSAVIADLSVPGGMGGLECLDCLSKIDPDVKVIACSGHSSDPVLLDAQARGFVAALEKPFRLNDVRSVLDRVLDTNTGDGDG
jgi:CheY-like chemotaxis protein